MYNSRSHVLSLSVTFVALAPTSIHIRLQHAWQRDPVECVVLQIGVNAA